MPGVCPSPSLEPAHRNRSYRLLRGQYALPAACGPAGQAGFTFIELLVVIAIISLLVSILLPSLNRAKELAKRMACMSQVKNIGLASVMYSNDNGGYLPGGSNNYSLGYQYDKPSTSEVEKPSAYGVLWPDYVSDPHMFYCLNGKKRIWLSSDGTSSWCYYGGHKFWPNDWRMTYWHRGTLDGGRVLKHWRLTEISTPSRFAILSDAWGWDLHDDGFNVLYADQHVIWLPDPDDFIADTDNNGVARSETWYFIDEEG
jgi:prepilin-type N-terminal cleavage/methylation domain-containing protein